MTSFKVYLYWWLGLFPHCAKYECSYQGSVVCPVKNDLRFICRDGWCISFWAAPQIPKAAGPLTHLTTGYYSQVLSTPHHSCIISSLAWWNGCQVDSTWCLPKLRSWEILFWRRSRNTRIRWIPAHPEITLTASSRDSVRYDRTQFINQNKPLWAENHVSYIYCGHVEHAYSLHLLIHWRKFTYTRRPLGAQMHSFQRTLTCYPAGRLCRHISKMSVSFL